MNPAERIAALLQHSEPEVRWLASYAYRLMVAANQVVAHLQRLSDPSFTARQQLEKALADKK